VSSGNLEYPVRQRFRFLLAVILSVLVCAAAASVSPRSAAHSRTEDRNGDGRPDVWRTYDRRGLLSKVAIDTNFDGRSDVEEYYEGGALVSREWDRNFDDRIDLVQQFDYTTHDQVRAVEDIDYDGTADVLRLFQGGDVVFSKWAPHVTPAAATGPSNPNPQAGPRTADDPLTPLDDPFKTDLAVSAVRVAAGSSDCVASSTSGWLPSGLDVGDRLASRPALEPAGHQFLPSAVLDPHAPRGPPASRS
jgi:hypothetical protein